MSVGNGGDAQGETQAVTGTSALSALSVVGSRKERAFLHQTEEERFLMPLLMAAMALTSPQMNGAPHSSSACSCSASVLPRRKQRWRNLLMRSRDSVELGWETAAPVPEEKKRKGTNFEKKKKEEDGACQCRRMNGRGWRCRERTLVGYSLCEYHLRRSSSRLKCLNSIKTSPGANKAKAKVRRKKKQKLLKDINGE
eukprot:TRINITY_DN10087_c0_g1_i1.p1 TRINITY_DN10087_c0_g1~~TRINITY_DN10087_c0_g1_i1.p1  ORF type:complete len:197 (-),score=20.64 TRINITY_DN10087_c0_g1_i1:201-791(-)